MKTKYAYVACLSAFLSCAAMGATPEPSKPEAFKQVMESGDGRYSLSFDPAINRFDVIKLDEGTSVPSQVKLSIHRKKGAPLDLKLQTVEKPDEPIHYSGQFLQWDASVTGVEMQMSFDKKTWKSVGRFLGFHPR